MWPFESANSDSVWASTSRSSSVSRRAHGSTRKPGVADHDLEELRQVGDDDVGAVRSQSGGLAHAVDADHAAEPARAASLDPGQRILEHGRVGGRDAERVGRREERVGRRLAGEALAKRRHPAGAFADDASVTFCRPRGRHLDGHGGAVDADHDRGVVQGASGPAPDRRDERLAKPTAPSHDGTARTGAQRDPAQVEPVALAAARGLRSRARRRRDDDHGCPGVVDQLQRDAAEAHPREPAHTASPHDGGGCCMGFERSGDGGDGVDIPVNVDFDRDPELFDGRRPFVHVFLGVATPAAGVAVRHPLGERFERVDGGEADTQRGGQVGAHLYGRRGRTPSRRRRPRGARPERPRSSG